MVEEIGKIISKGVETYTNNLNLGIPFVLNFFVTSLVTVIMLGLGFFYIFGSSLPSLEKAASPEAVISIVLPLIVQHILEIVILVIIIFLIILFFGAFFTAGAIGMARQAVETGKSELATMMQAGKKNLANLFLAETLVGLLSLAGIVFILPGAMKIDIAQLLSPRSSGVILLLVAGILLWVLYTVILSLVLAVFRYALVIDNLGPIDGVVSGLRFFNKHRSIVFLLWLITGAIAIILVIVGQVMGSIPVISIVWPFIGVFISVFIVEPLTTLWWVRLYMTGTDKQVYFNELLAHPNDLKKP